MVIRLLILKKNSTGHVSCDCWLNIYYIIYLKQVYFPFFSTVVGEKEKTNNAVNVRTRDNKIHGEISVTSAIDKLKNLQKSRTLNAEEDF